MILNGISNLQPMSPTWEPRALANWHAKVPLLLCERVTPFLLIYKLRPGGVSHSMRLLRMNCTELLALLFTPVLGSTIDQESEYRFFRTRSRYLQVLTLRKRPR